MIHISTDHCTDIIADTHYTCRIDIDDVDKMCDSFCEGGVIPICNVFESGPDRRGWTPDPNVRYDRTIECGQSGYRIQYAHPEEIPFEQVKERADAIIKAFPGQCGLIFACPEGVSGGSEISVLTNLAELDYCRGLDCLMSMDFYKMPRIYTSSGWLRNQNGDDPFCVVICRYDTESG